MKAALFLPLLLRLVAARPIGAILDETAVGSSHSPPASRVKPMPALPGLNGGAQSLEPIDNRPQVPSSSAIPSVVLASPSPIETTYLLSLQRNRGKQQAVVDAAPATSDKVEPIRVAPVASQQAEQPAAHGHQPTPAAAVPAPPCHHAYVAYRHRVDAAIIFFVAMFLLVIVKAESRGALDSRSSEDTIAGDKPQGVIRLEIGKPSGKHPLSIRAEHSSEQLVSEKTPA